ncbi:MAG: type II secretion system F family protein [Phycisphaerae bacterium]
MAKYTVQFASPDGKVGTETLEAGSERAAAAKIEADGRTPITVRLSGSGREPQASKRIRRVRGGKAGRNALLNFTHQMAAITESGIPLIAGLKAVGEQTDHARLRAAVARIIGRVEGGRGLAEAMDAEPDVFPVIYVKTVAAGEAAGNVPEVLESLARYMEQETETRSQVKSAMLYPALVVAALVIASAFMLIFVVPQFARMFDKFGGELPLPTRILLGISDVLTRHYLLATVGVGSVLQGLRVLFRYKGPRAWLDARVLKLPVFGTLLIGVYMTRFIELLSLLTRSALPITQALRITADSISNAPLKQDVRGIVRAVEGGRTLGEAFGETRWITPLVKRMLAIGEHAGRNDQILAYVSKYYETQTKRSIKLLSTLIEPVLITCLAAVVLFFALSIFLPMWKVLKLVGSA